MAPETSTWQPRPNDRAGNTNWLAFRVGYAPHSRTTVNERPRRVVEGGRGTRYRLRRELGLSAIQPIRRVQSRCDRFLQSLAESLVWRELFTLPQVPPVALETIRLAFSQITWPDETDDLRRDVNSLFAESGKLIGALSVDRLTRIPTEVARSAFPHLWRHARVRRGTVNADYLDPLGAYPRNHDQFVFFESDGDHVLVLPPALTAAAACVAIFTSVHRRAGKVKAGDIVGDTMEKAVAIGCSSHTGCVDAPLDYREGKTCLDIDVAVREGSQLVLFEAKSKSLTAKARTGDMMEFLFDYANGCIVPLRQLVRHERNIRRGLTPLTQPEDDINSLRITKVAVSPLCYGPSSDHVLAGSLFRAIVQARLRSGTNNPEHAKVLDSFNKELDRITKYLEHIASPRTTANLICSAT